MLPKPGYAAGSSYHEKRRWTHPHTIRCLESAIDLFGQPSSLVDLGCAEGVLVRRACELGIDAIGVDLAVPGDSDPTLVRADLCERLDLRRTFQWVLCWEVAEHLPESSSDRLCHTIVRHMNPAGRILFTAARPGQRGPGHINTQWPDYWIEKFAALGVQLADEPTKQIRAAWLSAAPRTRWYGTNAMVFWRVG